MAQTLDEKRAYERKWNAQNKSKRNAINQRNRKKKADWIREYKEERCCERCGFPDHRALQFHHTDPASKDRQVSDMTSWSIEKIETEISKCELLCANCHFIEHFKS